MLDAELRKWSERSCDELIAKLHDVQTYETEFESKTYQVEVMMLENTAEYVHVLVAVDDGVLPAAIVPASSSFICTKTGRQDETLAKDLK